ncbi:MAG: trimeric intracellular cation channel family protein [Sphaerochaetaceae bacterium]
MITQQSIMYGFDLFGTLIFAITGAVKGVRCKLDILGVIVFACTVGCGGGMLRDMLLGATPVAAFSNSAYIIICVCTGLVVFFLAPKFVGKWRTILFCDAIGLGVFTALGMAKGAMYGIGPVGQILCGVFSAVGGGVIRDVMSKSVPSVLTSDFYATASLIGGMVYLLLEKLRLPIFPSFLITALIVFILRVIAILFSFHLPVAETAFPVEDHLILHGREKEKK